LNIVNSFRISQLDVDFENLLRKQRNWPTPLAHGPDLYADFYHTTHSLAQNIVCASCGIIGHDVACFQSVCATDHCLRFLSVADDVYVPYDFSSGVDAIDRRHIIIDKQGLSGDDTVVLCNSCHKSIKSGRRPHESLANFRWVGAQPDELRDLTWLEELLIARAHLVARIVRLEERKTSSYFALKGHTVLLPQDTTRLLDLLPMSPSSLPDVVRVVWTGKSAPEKARLRSHFTVRKQKVYDALKWLCRHHEDYRQVTIDEERISAWESTMVATELLDSIAHVADPSAEDASRSGFATEDLDVESFEGDIPFNVSGILDINNVTQSPDVITLETLADSKRQAQNQTRRDPVMDITVNVVTGSNILNDYRDPTYFTSAFPTLFPYGTSKHIDSRHPKELQLSTWVQLLLKHSSRCANPIYYAIY